MSQQSKPICPETSWNSQKLFSKLALGTVQFGLDYGISNQQGKTPIEEVKQIFLTAEAHGIGMLDTAQAYGNSEEVIGKLSNNRFQVITKLNPNELNQRKVNELVTCSLDKLDTPFLFGVLFHDAQSALKNPEAVEALKNEKQQERIKKYGYSVYTPEELDQLLGTYGAPDLIQVPYSHLDRRFEQQLKHLYKQGVEIHTRSTFLQGLFFMDTDILNEFFHPVKDYIQTLQSLYKNTGVLAAYLLEFVLAQPFIDKVVVGVNDARQLKENLEALSEVKQRVRHGAPTVNTEILMPNLWPKS